MAATTDYATENPQDFGSEPQDTSLFLEPDELELHLPTGVKLAAKTWGNPAGRKVLGLHGFVDNAATFDRVAPVIVGGGDVFFCAVDFLGHGRSDHSPSLEYNHYLYLRDVGLVLHELGWDKCSVVGHSMGGMVAVLAAGVLNDRIESVIILDSGVSWRKPADTCKLLRESIEQTSSRAQKKWRVYDNQEACINQLLEKSIWKMERQSARCLIRRGTVATQAGVRFRHDLNLKRRSLVHFTREQVTSIASEIRCPMLCVVASQGLFAMNAAYSAKAVPWYSKNISQCRYIMVEGRHHAHLDNADVIGGVVVDFLHDGGEGDKYDEVDSVVTWLKSLRAKL